MTANTPDIYKPVLDQIATSVRLRIAHGAGVMPSIYVGSSSNGSFRVVPLNLGSSETKLASMEIATNLAAELDADFAITVMGAYTLPPSLSHWHATMLREFGSIERCPAGIESVTFILETPGGVFTSHAPITLVDGGRGGKRMGETGSFMLAARISGDMVGVLRPHQPQVKVRRKLH